MNRSVLVLIIANVAMTSMAQISLKAGMSTPSILDSLDRGFGWSATANIRRDLIGDGFTLSAGAGVGYTDECVLANLTFQRDFTRNRDVPPTDTVFLQITLKHLGEFQQRVF